MSDRSAQTPAARKAQASQQAMLDTLAGIAAARAKNALAPMAERLCAQLGDMAQAGGDAQAGYQRAKSGKLLKDNSYAWTHLASTAIELALRRALDPLRPGQGARTDALSLSLVPMDEMDSQLAFAALSRPFDLAHASVLGTLSVRLGLLLGRGVLRADANPFRPAVFLQALDEAWREFEPESAAHGLIQPLLRPDVVFDFAPLYGALAEALERKDGQPASLDAYRIQKTDDSAARAARERAKAQLAVKLRQLFGDDGGDDGVPLIPDLPTLPAGNGGWRPSGAAGFAQAAGCDAGAQSGIPSSAQTSMQPSTQPSPPQFAARPGGVPPGGVLPGGVPLQPGGVPLQAGAAAAAHAAPGFAMVSGGGAVPGAGFALSAPAVAVGGGGFQAGAANVAVQPGAPLLDLLARIEPSLAAPAAPDPGAARAGNVFYLPRFRQSLPKGSLARGDERTLDLLARVFETVLLDDSIPPQTRELLQALQLPVLKAALLDRQFFFEETHPARRLVDLMSRTGWEQRPNAAAGDDTLLQAMRRSVAKIAPDANPGAFAAAVAELEAGIAQEEQAREAALAAPVAHALKTERLEVATRAARDAVTLRLAAGQVEDVVKGFLEQRWTTVLTFAYSIESDKPGAVGSATRAMDDLIWSVQPKPTAEQKKSLIARLPRLLATLNKWLDAIHWQDAERLQFFARLAEYHAAIVRAPVELSPERQLELAVEAAQQDALRKVAMEKAAAEQAEQAEAQRRQASPLDGLERGTWCEFRDGDARRKVKLAWVSPMRTLFIFSGAGREEAFSMPADKLAAALDTGAARVLAIDGVVGQVLSEAMARGAENDAVIAARRQ